MKFVYPALFEKADEGGFTVTFPDFLGAVTEGDTLQDSLNHAEDCLGGILYGLEEDGKSFPTPSSIKSLPQNSEEVFFSYIKIDLCEYKKRTLEKPVRKTVYIPKGLNDEAEAKGINFSQVLRNALTSELRP